MKQEELNVILENHKLWLETSGKEGVRADLSEADLSEANLSEANLSRANLSRADLSGANLDFSNWPLWCGGLHVTTDRHIMTQFAYHFCAQNCDDPDYIAARNAILDFANQFHRADECGRLEAK